MNTIYKKNNPRLNFEVFISVGNETKEHLRLNKTQTVKLLRSLDKELEQNGFYTPMKMSYLQKAVSVINGISFEYKKENETIRVYTRFYDINASTLAYYHVSK